MQAIANPRLTHPKSILVATNLSDLHRVMPFALRMAGETGAQLELLHVLPFSAEFIADPSALPTYNCEGAHACAENVLQPWRERARKLGLQCTSTVRNSQPVAREIIAAVRQLRPDRLLLGTRSRGMLGRLLLGSVADQVLHSVNLPVFIVGPEAQLPLAKSDCQPTVLFPTTLGDGYQSHAALACQLAANQAAKLLILHVLPTELAECCASNSNVLYSTILYELAYLTGKVAVGSAPDVKIKLVHGNPAVEILSEAAANEASLIVMSAVDHSTLDNLTHDRTICRVLAHAHCPVLSLHGPVTNQMASRDQVPSVHEGIAVHR